MPIAAFLTGWDWIIVQWQQIPAVLAERVRMSFRFWRKVVRMLLPIVIHLTMQLMLSWLLLCHYQESAGVQGRL